MTCDVACPPVGIHLDRTPEAPYFMTHRSYRKLTLTTAWLLTLITIPILSLWGRPLQKWAFAQFGVGQIAVLLGISLSMLFLALIVYLAKTGKEQRHWLLLLLVLAVIFPLIQWKLPVVEERMHVLLFGLFGFFSVRLFPLHTGILMCIAISASDELLQFYLPDRVGDWHDVFLNLMSTGLGGALACFTRFTEQVNRET